MKPHWLRACSPRSLYLREEAISIVIVVTLLSPRPGNPTFRAKPARPGNIVFPRSRAAQGGSLV